MTTPLDQPHAPAPQPAGADERPTSVAAVVGLVGALLCWPVGLVASIIGLRHTKDGLQKGRGLAVAGVIISSVAAVTTIVVVAVSAYLVMHAATAAELSAEAFDTPAVQDDGTSAPTDPAAADADATSDPWDDVVVDTCESDDADALYATVTVTNTTSGPASYTVVVGFDDVAEQVVGRAAGQSATLAPGESAQVDLVGAGSDLPDELACYVDDVVRS